MTAHPVVLFDGVCTVCDSSVQFILDHDSEGTIHFAPLQSSAGRRLAAEHGIDASDLDTLVLIDNDRAWVRTDAVLRIASRLDAPWSWAAALRAVPRPVRDLAYRLLAMNRTHWFGSRTACRIPTPDVRARFLDL